MVVGDTLVNIVGRMNILKKVWRPKQRVQTKPQEQRQNEGAQACPKKEVIHYVDDLVKEIAEFRSPPKPNKKKSPKVTPTVKVKNSYSRLNMEEIVVCQITLKAPGVGEGDNGKCDHG